MRMTRRFWLFSILTVGLPAAANGASDIASSPLFLNSSIEPNVMFTLDDSGSMQFEIMPDDYVFFNVTNGSATFVFPRAKGVYGGSDYENRVATVDANVGFTALTRSPQVNTIYYNPAITYTPWVKADGSLYPAADPGCALHNPERPGTGAEYCRNLKTTNGNYNSNSWRTCTESGKCSSSTTSKNFWPATYYWHNGGSVWDWANYKKVEIRPTTAEYSGHGREFRTDCTDGVCSYDQEIQNFANWYTYYRSRILTARAGIGRAFSQQNGSTRVGFSAINKDSSTVDGVSNTPTVISGVRKFEGADRSNFFSTLYGHAIPAAGTPLRQAMDDVGRYFMRKDDKGPWGEHPGIGGGTQLECRQNYHILMTDGYWSGGSANEARTAPIRENNDGTGGPTIAGPDGESFTYKAISPFADDYENTLADVAMYYWKNDLRPDLDNKVPTSTIDPAFWQHVVTYGVGLGVSGSVNADAAWNAITSGASINWPYTDPEQTNCSGMLCAARLDDLLHASINGRGGFFSASDPESFADALSDILASIGQRTTAAAAAIATNSTRLNTETMVYQARFDSGEWSGRLLAFHLNSDGSVGSVQWDTDTTLASIDPGARKVWTWNGTAGVNFTWDNLSTDQQNALKTPSCGGALTGDACGQARLDWLRGGDSQEQMNGGVLRNRKKLLGDIINSDPVFVADENFGYVIWDEVDGGGEVYLNFLTEKQSRKEMLYVGANDGMLHGFDADTGEEQFTYVPAGVYGNLSKLTDPAYTHRYFVDGSPTAWDACIGPGGAFTDSSGNTVSTACSWRTVLVGSLRGGGKTIYALDITNPGDANFGKPLWEFSHDDLGYLAGSPQVVKLASGEWAVIFGNGYRSKNCEDLLNNVTNPNRNCRGKLFAVNLETGALISGFPVDTQVGDATNPNGIVSPPALYDVFGRILGDNSDSGSVVGDGIYVGDLRGNLWRFIYKGGSWQAAYKSGSTPAPLFVARDGSGNRQPITAPLEIGESPVAGQGVMVFFGTGRYFANTDTSDTSVQTFYGIWDDGTRISYTDRDSVLQAQTITDELTAFGREIRLISNNPVVWTGKNAKRGWYLDLIPPGGEKQGERVVSAPLLRFGRVIFSTLIPFDDPCSAGGVSWLMELNAQTGATLGYTVFDLNKDGLFNSEDDISSGNGSLPASGLKSTVGITSTPAVVSAGEKEYKLQTGTNLSGAPEGLLSTAEKGGIDKPRGAWRQLFQE
jgi:type IV pilus assembly protein PilY1